MQFKMILKKAEVKDGYVKVSMQSETLYSTEYVEVKNTKACQVELDKALQVVRDSGFKGTVYVAMYKEGRNVQTYDAWRAQHMYSDIA